LDYFGAWRGWARQGMARQGMVLPQRGLRRAATDLFLKKETLEEGKGIRSMGVKTKATKPLDGTHVGVGGWNREKVPEGSGRLLLQRNN